MAAMSASAADEFPLDGFEEQDGYEAMDEEEAMLLRFEELLEDVGKQIDSTCVRALQNLPPAKAVGILQELLRQGSSVRKPSAFVISAVRRAEARSARAAHATDGKQIAAGVQESIESLLANLNLDADAREALACMNAEKQVEVLRELISSITTVRNQSAFVLSIVRRAQRQGGSAPKRPRKAAPTLHEDSAQDGGHDQQAPPVAALPVAASAVATPVVAGPMVARAKAVPAAPQHLQTQALKSWESVVRDEVPKTPRLGKWLPRGVSLREEGTSSGKSPFARPSSRLAPRGINLPGPGSTDAVPPKLEDNINPFDEATAIAEKDAEMAATSGMPRTESATWHSMDLKEWIRSVDNGKGFLLRYEKHLLDNYDTLDQIIELYVQGHSSDESLRIHPALFDDLGIEKIGHRRLFEKWFRDRLTDADALQGSGA